MGELADLLRTRLVALSARLADEGTTAFRLCDTEAGAPVTVDWYDGAVVAHERAGADAPPDAADIAGALGIDPELVFVKERRRQRDRQHGGQYQVVARAGAERVVRERGLAFHVNLSDYLDTGLFLDHRPLRCAVGLAAHGARLLNLFAYTGAFTVHAAAGGAATTLTIDLSNTYLRRADRNLEANRLRGDHRLLKADCLRWLASTHRERFDLIVCDPPTFSNSKGMARSWDVSRDHPWVLWRLYNLLAPGGTAWFSTNKRGFSLTAAPPPFTGIEDVTADTIGPDFAGTVPHRCWRLRR